MRWPPHVAMWQHADGVMGALPSTAAARQGSSRLAKQHYKAGCTCTAASSLSRPSDLSRNWLSACLQQEDAGGSEVAAAGQAGEQLQAQAGLQAPAAHICVRTFAQSGAVLAKCP